MALNITRRATRVLLRHRAWFIALLQAGLIFCALVFAWLLRFEFTLPDRALLFSAAPVLIAIQIGAIAYFNLLHGWWRYTGTNDAIDIAKAVTAGTLGFWVLMHTVLEIRSFPRSIFILEALLATGLLAGVRLLSRVIAESVRKDFTMRKRVILIGAGFAAQMIIRETLRRDSGHFAVVCVDDNPSKRGIRIHGVPVVGPVDALPALLASYPADEVLIAVPSASTAQMRRFTETCQRAGVRFRTVPALKDLIAGQVTISQVREVNLEDLLGREPAQIDLEAVRKQIAGQVVVVTGAAGSIGSELCRQILGYHPARLVCLDQSETGMFHLQRALSNGRNGTELAYCVADIQDSGRMRHLFSEHAPSAIFHAAAYKHVPVMEWNVSAAVKNNVFALLSLLDVAESAGCNRFVMISSDKAVNPTSVMGVTKRVGELILSSRPASRMRCVTVRFGNVLGSSGSVVPILQEQLQQGLPLTITHPDIRRFFMTTHEAVSLVLEGFAIGEHRDILVLDMGDPVRVVDLARSLIRLSGKSEDQVSIQFIGLRDGEKLREELFYAYEETQATRHEKIRRVGGVSNGWPHLSGKLQGLRTAMRLNGQGQIRAMLREIVPEYSYLLKEPAEASPALKVMAASAGQKI